MNKNSKNIILISTGNFQEHILDNIEQLLLLKLNIHIIIDKTFFNYVKHYESHITIIFTESLNINYFDKNTKLISKFRNNFLNNCSKRLFLLYEYMKKENIINVIHFENDVLFYNNMDYNFQKKIYITMDSKNRCIPGIVYIPNYTLLEILIVTLFFLSLPNPKAKYPSFVILISLLSIVILESGLVLPIINEPC